MTVIGDGAFATTAAVLLAEGGHDVTMWGRNPQRLAEIAATHRNLRYLPDAKIPDTVKFEPDPGRAAAGARLIIWCVPTQFLRAMAERFIGCIAADASHVSCGKGIEFETLARPTQILADVLNIEPARLAAMSGPNLAAEIVKGLPATSVVAGECRKLTERTRHAFARPHFRVYTNDDVIGIELAGAIKNVIALAAGAVDGLGLGSNAKASLVTRGLVEMRRLGAALGAKPETFDGLAGMGDLIVTCNSTQSRNYTVGHRVGKGEKLDDVLASMPSVAEGVSTARSVLDLAKRHGVEMPICQAVHRVLFSATTPGMALYDLMTREPKAERKV